MMGGCLDYWTVPAPPWTPAIHAIREHSNAAGWQVPQRLVVVFFSTGNTTDWTHHVPTTTTTPSGM
jgi:hypothetical protein